MVPIGTVIIGAACLVSGAFLGRRWRAMRPRSCSQISAREAELLVAVECAEQADHAKSEFLANTCHDIRTPLTAILGYIDLLQDELSRDRRARTWVDVMHRNGQHLLGLLNDVLDFAKIEARKMTVETVECSPIDLLHDVRSLMSVRADDKRLQFLLQFAGPIPQRIKTDPTRVRQILINLISNAIKFTDSGSVIVRCGLDLQSNSPRLRIDVIDTGLGLTIEQQQRVFEAFAQADDSHTRRFGGTGLGLTISRHLAHLLGGDVSVQSVAGRGSTFTFTFETGSLENIAMNFPTAEAAPTPSPRLGEATEPSFAPAGAETLCGLRILLADDGIDNRRMIELVLGRAGAIVTSVDDGSEAVSEALRAGKSTPFDVVLLDMEMPTLDGYCATRQLRDAGYRAPVIALTANAMCGERERCLAAGCDDFATKPINRRELLQTIARWTSTNGPGHAQPSAEQEEICSELEADGITPPSSAAA